MLQFLTAGESHGPALMAILDGLPAGLPLAPEDLQLDLTRRQQGFGVGPRVKGLERDRAQFIGGVVAGETTGAPVGLLIPNRVHERWAGRAIEPMSRPRPGHADLTAAIKFGYRHLRLGSERASARETAARVAVGAVCGKLLREFDIRVGSYVTRIGAVEADLTTMPLAVRLAQAEESEVRCPSEEASAAMIEAIEAAMEAGDTVGGAFEVVVLGVPPGLGSHTQWDDRLETRLAAAIMSIQAIKGVGIGGGFELAAMRGTEAQDAIILDGKKLGRPTNRAGGIEGGISNGNPIIVQAAMKPISSTLTPQPTVDLVAGEPSETDYERSDFCVVPRAAVVGEAMVAFVLAQVLLEKLGGDHLQDLKARFGELRRADLRDLLMSGESVVFWPGRDDDGLE